MLSSESSCGRVDFSHLGAGEHRATLRRPNRRAAKGSDVTDQVKSRPSTAFRVRSSVLATYLCTTLRSDHPPSSRIRKTHADKADAAERLHDQHGVPDVSQLLVALNEARKATAYGDAQRPDLDPEEVASEIEEFVDSIENLIEGR